MKRSVNPFNGKVLASFEMLTDPEIDQRLRKAEEAFEKWRWIPISERAELMHHAAKILEDNKEAYAEVMTDEMGKPISQSLAEVEKCAWVCRFYADNAEGQLSDEMIPTNADKSYVRFDPLGVVLAVMPWNYPFWQVFRFAAPALMAGNVGVLKHASNVQKCAFLLEQIFLEAGFPEGCFQNLVIETKQVERIIKDPIIRAVTLTGSMPAGSAVAAVAGSEIKKTVLELGGSNALVVFADADIDAAVETCIHARFQNTGQSCIAGKRLLLQENIAEIFISKFVEKVENLKSGDPAESDTYIGVQAREDLAEELEDQVNRSIEMGAVLLTGGTRDKAYYEPTVLDKVTPVMPVFIEETFGPAIGITRFTEDSEAVELVNRSEFGLGVSIFTSNQERVKRLIPQFDEGAVFVNELVKSDPRLPFGGVKISGYGRELSRHGILEFVNKKTVYIRGI